MVVALILTCVALAIGLLAVAFACIQYRKRLRVMERRMHPISDAAAALDRVREEAQATIAALTREERHIKLRTEELKKTLGALEDDLDIIAHGLYRPAFEFEDMDDHKDALRELYEQQRAMIQEGTAAECDQSWSRSGDQTEGERMVRDNVKLVLRAFNGDAESAIALVTWRNYTKMRERIQAAKEQIEALAARFQITINAEYVALKLRELKLTFEFEERKERERSEQRELQAEAREGERERRAAEREAEEAETEQERAEAALAKAREQSLGLHGAELAAAAVRVATAEARAKEAAEKSVRAISSAQRGKAGYVYIISNIGSFGEDVYKIGMTRRDDPNERVAELSDASVPFAFDIHALIKADDAPALEYELHEAFWHRRVNRENDRKDFFRVSLVEIREYARSKGFTTEFTMLEEAKQFRLSQEIENQLKSSSTPRPMSADATQV